ncbi:hypothetical protein [Spirillospora sp. NPDC047279]|uniref:hypothetical protein n=1 Tax=Spirillospora sp. NPDC047279 TaxID=3155478 RepID=UPI0033F1CFD3
MTTPTRIPITVETVTAFVSQLTRDELLVALKALDVPADDLRPLVTLALVMEAASVPAEAVAPVPAVTS